MGPESFILLSTESGVVLSHVEFQLFFEWEVAKVIKVSCKFGKVIRSCLRKKNEKVLFKSFFENIAPSSKTRMKVNVQSVCIYEQLQSYLDLH